MVSPNFNTPTKVPKLDNPINTLQREFDDMLGVLLGSLQGNDETQITNEVDLMARAQQHRRAILVLKNATGSVKLYQPET